MVGKQTYPTFRGLNNLMRNDIFTKAATVAYCSQASSILAKSLPGSKTRSVTSAL
jgi:hypothetical protein